MPAACGRWCHSNDAARPGACPPHTRFAVLCRAPHHWGPCRGVMHWQTQTKGPHTSRVRRRTMVPNAPCWRRLLCTYTCTHFWTCTTSKSSTSCLLDAVGFPFYVAQIFPVEVKSYVLNAHRCDFDGRPEAPVVAYSLFLSPAACLPCGSCDAPKHAASGQRLGAGRTKRHFAPWRAVLPGPLGRRKDVSRRALLC